MGGERSKKKEKTLNFFFCFFFFCQERRTPRLMSRMVRGCRAKEKKRHLSAAQGRLSSAPMAVSTIVDFFLIGRKRVTHVFSLFAVQETDRQEEKKKKGFFFPNWNVAVAALFFSTRSRQLFLVGDGQQKQQQQLILQDNFYFLFFWGGLIILYLSVYYYRPPPTQGKKKENVGHLSFDYLLKNILEEIIVGLSKEQNKQIKTTKIKIIE